MERHREKEAALPQLPDFKAGEYIPHITDDRFYFGMPNGIRVLLTTEGETDLFAAPSIIVLPPDHPLIRDWIAPEPPTRDKAPVTISMPRRPPPPPIPASDPPPVSHTGSTKDNPFHLILETTLRRLDQKTSRLTLTTLGGLPLCRAGP